MVLSFINAGILSTKILPMVGALALAYGGIVQLLAGMWAFIKNDTFAAVALSSYGGFWISFYLLQSTFLKQIPVSAQPEALALYLFAWGAFTLYMWIASMRVSVAVQSVFITLVPTYVLLALGKAVPSLVLFHIGGAFGIATAACAWYVSAAIVFKRTFRRNVLPMFETRTVQQDVGP
jgi:succinate-acetate transporter protein